MDHRLIRALLTAAAQSLLGAAVRNEDHLEQQEAGYELESSCSPVSHKSNFFNLGEEWAADWGAH